MNDTALLKPASKDPLVGRVVQERYKIVRKIGEGGMGSVYEGEHLLIKRRVAIKCLHAQFATNAEIVARFQNEAMAANSIQHKNIIEVTDMGRFEDGTVYMVLEFLDGKELADILKSEGPQPLGRVVKIMMQVCDALDAAHSKGIVHRDLKPENIFIIHRSGTEDFVKVLDFGIAKILEGANKGMTRTGTTLGTPYYMAPEQAQARRDLDGRADIYSMGVILFHALTGQHPFEDESYPMLVVKICTEPPPPLQNYRPDIAPEFAAIVANMLAKEPSQRYRDCMAVKQALAPFANEYGAPVVRDSALPTAKIAPTMHTSGLRPAEPNTATAQATPVPAPAGPSGDTRMGNAGAATPPQMPYAAPASVGQADISVSLPPTSKTPLIIGIVAGLFGVAGLAGGGAYLATQGEDDPPVASLPAPTPPAAPTPDPTPPPERAAPEPSPAPAAQESGDMMRVQITVTPTAAEVFLNGEPIANPFDADLRAGDQIYELEARADGYRTVLRSFVLRVPQRVNITLERGRGVSDERRHRPSPTMAPSMVATPAGMASDTTVMAPPAMVAVPPEPPPSSPTMMEFEDVSMIF
ncbi:MAG: protein kinase [Myxococcota bacterium]